MEYTVLARRFRPQAFAEVVGQQNVAQALRNAISAERVAHAYLFTGARGVGKTSMARILAKSLNCPNAVEGNPCNTCDVCEAISAGRDLDVLEIDGASNRGIDEIRSLRANVGVRSMRSKYKIYIVDEVHMLTKEAFNALLKTLEEPPPNVKFIFCTTDPQKLPDTILSRCQRFDFGTIATPSIIQRLKEIATAEGVEVEPAALELVARRAAGSMRDSQSLFDQLLAFGGKQVTATSVHGLLGTAPDERLVELSEALIDRRRDLVLSRLDDALKGGVQISELTEQLVALLRDLMVLAAGAKEVALQSVAEDHRRTLEKQANTWGLQTIVAALQILAEAKQRMKSVTHGRALTELALIRISLLTDMEQISQIVQLLKSGKVVGSTPARPDAPPRTAPSAERRTPAAAQNITAEAMAVVQELRDLEPAPAESADTAEAPQVEEPVQMLPTIPVEPGRESEILSQLIARNMDPQIAQLKGATGLAILGPKHLVISFPKAYDWLRQSLDRPASMAKLEQVAAKVVGFPLKISFRIDEAQVKAAPPPIAVRNQAPPKDIAKDPLIQKVVEIFGAEIVRVEATPEAAGEPEGG